MAEGDEATFVTGTTIYTDGGSLADHYAGQMRRAAKATKSRYSEPLPRTFPACGREGRHERRRRDKAPVPGEAGEWPGEGLRRRGIRDRDIAQQEGSSVPSSRDGMV